MPTGGNSSTETGPDSPVDLGKIQFWPTPGTTRASARIELPPFADTRAQDGRSEAPHQPARSPEIVLAGAQRVAMDIGELQAPGKHLKKEELKFAMHSAAKRFDD